MAASIGSPPASGTPSSRLRSRSPPRGCCSARDSSAMPHDGAQRVGTVRGVMKRIFAVLAMLWALPVSPVSAIQIQLTSGGLFQDNRGPFPFEFVDTGLGLQGPGFFLSTDPRFQQPFIFREGPP